jgi:alkylation response protein AidB-like acyl-CoA dehydrogenase
MFFGFTADQIALRDGLRDVLKTHDLPGTDAAPPDAQQVWRRLADVGLPGALLPEDEGGLGLDVLDLLPCLEESGRAAVPVPLVETTVAAATLLSGTQHAQRLAGGRWRVTASLDGSRLAAWAESSDAVLVTDGDRVRLLEPVTGEAVAGADPYRALVALPAAAVDAAEVVGEDPARLARARRATALATAAQLTGLADGALTITVGYVRERHQFGVPVGSFQAVQHRLADALLALELARPLVHAAGWAHRHDTATADRDVAAAVLRAGAAADEVAKAALQCHGGTGYTREYPLHRWLLRIWALRAAAGPVATHRGVLAAALGLAPPPPER